jgi:hypothetical protein
VYPSDKTKKPIAIAIMMMSNMGDAPCDTRCIDRYTAEQRSKPNRFGYVGIVIYGLGSIYFRGGIIGEVIGIS